MTDTILLTSRKLNGFNYFLEISLIVSIQFHIVCKYVVIKYLEIRNYT